MNLFKKRQLTAVQVIITLYFIAVSGATLLLSMPVAHKPGVKLSFIDTFFTAVSAISVTGLTVVSTADTFSVVGIFFLALILQIGGVGVMALGTFIWILIGKKIGLRQRKLIMTDYNRPTMSGLVSMMLEVLGIIMLIEAIGTIILGTYFLNFYSSPTTAYYHGFFAAVSATTNAGFDITGNSLLPFANDYFVQGITIILMISGAIGFPVLVEIKDFLAGKFKFRQFSLFTKIAVTMYFSLLIIGTVFILFNEWNGFLMDKSWSEKIAYSLFQSTSTRSTGLTTMDINDFSLSTQLFMSVLMFIGASPTSVGGGIRTTTLALILLGTFSFARGRTTVKIFKRELYQEDVNKSFVVATVAVFITVASVIILTITESFPLLSLIFEVASAFGTCGLSTGITPELSSTGKLLLTFLMFIGRIGILSFLFMIRGEVVVEKFHYPKERVIIGQ